MLVVDLMHEFELGVWRALFIHLLRMLEAINPNLLHGLDHRYVKLPTISSELRAHAELTPDIGRSLHLAETQSGDSPQISQS
jgi:hypothetical protein